MEAIKCNASHREILNDSGSVVFPCPACGKPIVRTKNAREIVGKYTCECGFSGPN
jgi:predicted RNA-binding Zn-ribbon protein involved in translation (DUF1610 family)